ncbi:glycoside hydrolase family 30 protein [uncultured Draconibacterium sp.]|uniref:glycoside hydrolase family 30 protein n=1 Tax=uncultured Draconibacterium sp. TaxID=1573823 RepID=UPI002AA9189C|nr:glycoside hydrolase family 30 protein [uncultured Draconibacterium sp.]
MKILNISLFFLLFCAACSTKTKVEWVNTTPTTQWKTSQLMATTSTENADAEVYTDKTQQVIDGFGSCFNELGWTSLSELSEADRESIMNEFFAPGVGANFTICRMPVAANDFALNWYSYNETESDFAMENFSIENDKNTLIPFINNAKQYNPDIKIWASPWSPPSWMKYNKHYASSSSEAEMKRIKHMMSAQVGNDSTLLAAYQEYFKNYFDPKYQNDLSPENEGKEGTDMFIQQDKYLEAYALYFLKFIEAYRNEGIDIFAVMPQNEFNSAQVFPSCCWTAAGLSNFIGSYLGPVMQELGVDVYFGTMERPNEALIDTILQDPESSKYVKGVGFQWAGKNALPGLNKRYPDLAMFQTEQECGNGKNDWTGAMHSWDLMKHYLNNGVSVYEYWNTSLLEGGVSRWGWEQNSLVVVDAAKKAYRYSYEYYILKHASHFVLPGAKKLETGGEYNDLLAFKNPDCSIIVIAGNQDETSKKVNIKIGDTFISPVLPAQSLNTFKISNL